MDNENRTKPLTAKEAAKYCGTSKAAIYTHTSKKTIPFHRSGVGIRFLESELLAWMSGEEVE